MSLVPVARICWGAVVIWHVTVDCISLSFGLLIRHIIRHWKTSLWIFIDVFGHFIDKVAESFSVKGGYELKHTCSITWTWMKSRQVDANYWKIQNVRKSGCYPPTFVHNKVLNTSTVKILGTQTRVRTTVIKTRSTSLVLPQEAAVSCVADGSKISVLSVFFGWIEVIWMF